MQETDLQDNQGIEIYYIDHLHIPHTGGRVLNGYLWRNPQLLAYHQQNDCVSNDTAKEKVLIHYSKIHNAIDIQKIKDNKRKMVINYFILRDPILRSYKEYQHYNRNLKNIGRVNHLELAAIQKQWKLEGREYSLDSIHDYFSLEVNRNVMCKFLLGRIDFSRPITDAEYQQCLSLFSDDSTSDNKGYIFDIFDETQIIDYPKFFEIIQRYKPINLVDIHEGLARFKTLINKYINVLPPETSEYLSRIHAYDLALYRFLIEYIIIK